MKISTSGLKRLPEIAAALAAGNVEQTASGVLFPTMAALVSGMYVHDVNGADERTDHNLVTIEGLNYMLNTSLRAQTPETAWFLALFAGNVAPQASWTAANFTANSTEIVSSSQGYTETTRRPWTAPAAVNGNVTNTASKASFTIAATSTLTVNGGGLLSASAKGGTTGVLMSASKFATARNLENGDIFNLGYALTLTST